MPLTASPARTRSGLASALAVASALLVTAAVPAGAMAAPVSQPDVTATIVLRTPSPAATASLAATTGISRTQRLSRLRALLPTATVQSTARSSLAALGLTVDDSTPWTVVVHGPAAAVAALNASGSRLGPSSVGTPSRMPAAQTVISGGPVKHFAPRAFGPLQGSDFRTAYAASSAVPTGTPPVIATLQLAGWDSADLTTYASSKGLPLPSPSTFTPVLVDQASMPATSDDSIEVALDQEAIYSVAPYAHQRAYIAPNDVQGHGYLDAIYRIAQDAVTGTGIVALSTSWGGCEADDGTDYMAAMHAAIQQLVAAGVTMFAASGDDGSYDCADSDPTGAAVDYPASDPFVVGVGGTDLDLVGPVETAWGNSDTPDHSFEGSGGGQSLVWPRPAYQAGVAPTATVRQVPDIAADASDKSPFQVRLGSSTYAVFGTSLAAPISAALLTAELSSRGLTSGGVGDIHAALYAAPPTSFRDVTVGTNGAYAAAPGYDLVTGLGAPNWHAIVDQLVLAPVVHVPAYQRSRTITPTVTTAVGQVFVGWASGTGPAPACTAKDTRPAAPAPVTVTQDGVYSVWVQGYLGRQSCLTGVATVVVDNAGPALSVTAKASSPTGKTVKYSWHASDQAGVAGVSVSVLRNGKRIWTGHTAGSGSVTLKGKLGSSYQLVAAATDTLGNAVTAKRSVAVGYDDRNLTLSAGWSRTTSHSSFGGSLVRSSRTAATARVKAFGSSYSLLTVTAPNGGVLAVYVDGRHVRDVNLAGKAKHVVVKLAAFKTAKVRSVTLRVKAGGTAGKPRVVSVDGLIAL